MFYQKFEYFSKKTILIPLAIDKQRTPRKGDILLSEPFLMDKHFTRSVIFMCEHAHIGSFGLILNNTLDLSLDEISNELPAIDCTIGLGGPVEQTQLFFLHTFPQIEGAEQVLDDVYLGGNFEDIKQLYFEGKVTGENIRFFVGYTGWGMEQLNQELEEKTWIVMDPPADFNVFKTDDDHLWKDLIATLGGKYKRMADYPINPADN